MKVKAMLLAVLTCVMLSSCDMPRYNKVETAKSEDGASMFVLVERARDWYVVYHKNTKVMYAVSAGTRNYGMFTLLVDADGKPMLYEEK